MHERVFCLLLRLYPAQFRRTHGHEALLLLQDRLRDETGFVRRLRLWCDLVGDVGAIRIRGYRELSAVPMAASICGPQGVPSFVSLEEERLSTRSWFWGGVFSVLLCAAALFALEHGRGHLPFHKDVASYAAPEVSRQRVHVAFTSELLHSSKKPMVRLKAVVTPLDRGPMPTGTVTFDYGWTMVASGTLVDGAIMLDAKLPDSKGLTMDALYLGDANYSIARSNTEPGEAH